MSDTEKGVITGASKGIGLATSQQLAAGGAHLFMVSRDPARGATARDEVAGIATGLEPKFLASDLSSQTSIRALAVAPHDRAGSLDVLINNAGTASGRRVLTVDGPEMTFAVNHLAPFLLTQLVLDLLVAAPAARVVNTVSETNSGRFDFGNLQGERRYSFFSAYARSKAANGVLGINGRSHAAYRPSGGGERANGCLSRHVARDRGSDRPVLLPWQARAQQTDHVRRNRRRPALEGQRITDRSGRAIAMEAIR